MRQFKKVVGTRVVTYPKNNPISTIAGRSFGFEVLECGDLGECLGVVGEGGPPLKEPATKRICDWHDEDDEDD